MDVFGFLAGISPWWWVAAALALAIVEVLTFSFFLIWPGLAALAVAIVLWIVPDLSGAGQLLVFAVLSIALTWAGRLLVVNSKPESEAPGLNSRSEQLIGRSAKVLEPFDAGGVGAVEVDGVRWRGRLEGAEALQVGQTVRVTGADGMLLVLSPGS